MEESQKNTEIASCLEVNIGGGDTNFISDVDMNIDMGSEDTNNIHFEINENTDVNETTDSSDTENYTNVTEAIVSEDRISYADENTSYKEELDDQNIDIADIKTEVDTGNNFVELNTDNVLEMFPFVCGLCDMKFNSISTYLTHFQMHTHVDKYLHCCIQKDIGKENEHSDLFSCGVCWLRYPSLCTLYKHLVEDEGIQDFSFNGSKRTANFLFDQSKSETCSSDVEHTNKVVNECSEECKIEAVDSIETLSVYNTRQDDDIAERKQNVIDDIAERKKIFVPKRTPKRRIMSKLKQNKSREKHMSTEDSGLLSQAEGIIRNAEDVKQKAVKQFSEDETENKIYKIMSSRKREKCDICGKEYTKSNKSRHMKKHSDVDMSLSCIVCGKGFLHNFSLKRHIDAVHTEVKNHKCEICDQVFSYTWQNRKNGRLTGTDFPCETCGKMLKYGSLQGHRATHEKHIFPCDLCNLKFQSKAWMQTHRLQVHATDKKFTCDECGKSFKALSYLRQHSQTHRKERNIQCPVCAKTFLYKNVLRIHLLTHSESKPYHCNICGKGFKRQHDILVHKEGVHEAVEKYPCTDCDKKFTTKDRLRKHRLIHLPPRFTCQFCGKSFVRNSYLRIHLKVHGQTA